MRIPRAALLIPAYIASALAISSCVASNSIGTPLGRSLRTQDSIATLIVTQEPYFVSLNRNPENDRFRIGLLLVPVAGGTPRMVPLAGALSNNQFRLARILGFDGITIWFIANQLGGVELKSGKLVTVEDLQRANPSLGNVWVDQERNLQFSNRLRLSTYSRETYEIDPTTLKAATPRTEHNFSPRRSEPAPADYLRPGGMLSATEWLGAHTQAEVDRDFKPGSSVSRVLRVEDSRQARGLYLGRIDQTAYGPRFGAMVPVGGSEYMNGAFLSSGPDEGPLRLSRPDAFILLYLLKGTIVLARIDGSGKPLWEAQTGVGELQQILPGEASTALVGLRPRVHDQLQEPLLALVDHRTGAVSVVSLWRHSN
jgi:hypothetical protein